MTTGERIKILRLKLGMTQEELGQKVGVKTPAIYKYENGLVVNLKRSTIESLAEALETTPSFLMGFESEISLPQGALPMPRFVKKPRLGTIACGKPILAVEEANEFDDVPETVECDFTLLCKGDSMINARIFDGDVVYIRAQPQVETGEIAAVRIGDEATLKRVYYTPGSDRITLRAANPLYPDMEYNGPALNDIEILGKAVAFTSIIR